jgi:hypothetical protein
MGYTETAGFAFASSQEGKISLKLSCDLLIELVLYRASIVALLQLNGAE